MTEERTEAPEITVAKIAATADLLKIHADILMSPKFQGRPYSVDNMLSVFKQVYEGISDVVQDHTAS